ncbi:MAG: UbiX family flavin prenyltransferase [Candidatus Micrarchaeota archaeon]|nr:UbiX family flavin prenyltransferase [Candidatus Micrarchaeota archaeon]
MRILLAITGASGIIYARRLHEALSKSGADVCVVVSSAARKLAQAEGERLPRADYDENDLAAPFASGSHRFDAVVVCPCSLKTLGEIAGGIGSTLVARAAEVALKERRKLILVVRETPLSLVAIENMRRVTLAGGIVMPACPGFYGKPRTIEELADFMAGRVLDQLGIENRLFRRWGQ